MTECKFKIREMLLSVGNIEKSRGKGWESREGQYCVAIIGMPLCLHGLVHMCAVSVGMCMRVYSFMYAQVPFHMNANVCV